uniref:Uncharacterized protein n=1 Tax=Thermosporothrix sp. COM3 TaxID=2490863 RepID=A0A455SJM8_9CHLR|nr:hypothetical protein KTC_19100 [Thermosporothrix sp. COM3]
MMHPILFLEPGCVSIFSIEPALGPFSCEEIAAKQSKEKHIVEWWQGSKSQKSSERKKEAEPYNTQTS